MNKVYEYLWIGAHRDLALPEMLKNVGIKHIIKLYADRDDLCKAPEGFEVYESPMPDGAGWIDEDFRRFNEVIEGMIGDGSILICCAAGKSRSAIVVLNHIMHYRLKPIYEALEYLKKCRPEIDPSLDLLGALMHYYKLHPYLSTIDRKWA